MSPSASHNGKCRKKMREYLTNKLKAAVIIAGTDISFGDKGAGNAALLREMSEACGYRVEKIIQICFYADCPLIAHSRLITDIGNRRIACSVKPHIGIVVWHAGHE